MPPFKRQKTMRKKVLSSSILTAFSVLLSCSSVAHGQAQQEDSFLALSQERLAIEPSDTFVPRGSNVPPLNREQAEISPQFSERGASPSQPVSQQRPPPQQNTAPVNLSQQEILRMAREEQALLTQPLPSPLIQHERPDLPREVENQLYPMTTSEIREILSEMNKRQGAAIAPNHIKTVGTSSQYEVDMTLGASPPVVRIEKGLGAMVNFVDAQGSPWPIESATNFHAEAASVSQVAAHVLSVSAMSPFLSGSVGVILEGLKTPIQFVIIPATDVRDYRVDLRIPQLGPESTPMITSSGKPSLGGGNIKEFLYGATPHGAERLRVSGSGAEQSNTRAWQNVDGRLVIRTSAQVISPSWIERESALDGTSIYVLSSTPVVKVSVDGKESTFYIDGLKPVAHFTKK